jgi:hypothetical protein
MIGAALALAAVTARAQAPVPESALRGQNATPQAPPPLPAVAREIAFARLHHAALREVQLGDLGALRGDRPDVRAYGATLAAQFRAFDDRVLAAGARKRLSEATLTSVYAGENVDALRREADDLSRLGATTGAEFDRAFLAAVAQEQSAAADILATLAARPSAPAIQELTAAMAAELERASVAALAVAGAMGPQRR